MDSLNQADALVPVPALLLQTISTETEDILLETDPALDTDWGEIAPWDSADSNWHEP